MKKVILIIIAILTIIAISVTFFNVGATDISTESAFVELEESSELVGDSTAWIEIEDGEAEEIISVIEHSDTKAEAILSLAGKLGITTEEAEALINAVIDVGDEYMGDNAWWVGFKNDVQQDIQFWTVAIVLITAVLAIIGGVFVLLAKTNPTMKKAMWGMAECLNINTQMKNENSQTLGELKLIFEKSAEKLLEFEKLIEVKEDYIASLEIKIKDLEETASVEHTNMVKAEIYNLRMLKLVLDRTAMPLADKATIDLFYTKGIEALKDELTEEDIEKIENTIATLSSVNSAGDM